MDETMAHILSDCSPLRENAVRSVFYKGFLGSVMIVVSVN